ncbi:MAG: hypothetical protein WC346_15905 [Methanogenium sp.]|jgi:uncharacterized membrane protein
MDNPLPHKGKYHAMNRLVLDATTVIASIIVLIVAVIVLPSVLPAPYAYITAILLFIACMSAGGFYIGQKTI